MADLIARQLEKALRNDNASPPVDVMVLLDGSSSVGQEQFEIMRLCTRQIVDIFPSDDKADPSLRLGIIQFSGTVKIECNLVSNISEINCAITAMRQLGGGTTTLAALKQAKFMFDTYRRAAHHCIIFFTDGDVEQGIAEACTYRDTENIHIVTIGVGGNVNPLTLAKMSSNNCSFHFTSYENLRNVFTHLDRTPLSPPGLKIVARGTHNVTLQMVLPPDVSAFIEWEAQWFNFQTNKWENMGTSQGDVQCVYNLKHNTKYRVRGKVFLVNKTWTSESPLLEFRTLDESPLSPILRSEKLRIAEFEKYKKELLEARPGKKFEKFGVKRLNILLLGRMGAGKSSHLNTHASSFAGKFSPVAPFRDDMKTVTHTLKMYPLTRNSNEEPVVCGYDVYGWSESNYKNSELGYILAGNVKTNYPEGNTGFNADKTNPFYIQHPTFNDKIHAVIVLVSALTVGSVTEMDRLKEFYTFLTDKGIQPLFVMTKVDRLPDEVLLGHPENLFDSGIVDAVISSFCNLSSIPRPSVLPVINYQGPFEKPDYVIHFSNVLLNAVHNAKTFLQNRYDDMVEEQENSSRRKSKTRQKESDSEESDQSEEESKSSEDEEETKIKEKDRKRDKDKEKGKKKGDEKSSKKSSKESPPSTPTSRKGSESKNTPPSKKKSESKDTPTTPESTAFGTVGTPPPTSAIMDLTEAAQYLKIEEDDLIELLESKDIKARKFGSKWRISKEEIDRYMS